MTERRSDGEFRTANMAMAAFLSFHLEPLRSEWRDGTCFWFFTESDELNALVTTFQGGKALVDPRAFSYKLTTMRKEIRERPDPNKQQRQ